MIDYLCFLDMLDGCLEGQEDRANWDKATCDLR